MGGARAEGSRGRHWPWVTPGTWHLPFLPCSLGPSGFPFSIGRICLSLTRLQALQEPHRPSTRI